MIRGWSSLGESRRVTARRVESRQGEFKEVVVAKKKRVPTGEQVQAEIDALTEIKPKVRRFSAFGDDHHAAIDAQMEVLCRLDDEDDVCARYDEEPQNVQDAAREAAQWLAGDWDVKEHDGQKKPSESWRELVVK